MRHQLGLTSKHLRLSAKVLTSTPERGSQGALGICETDSPPR
jgi:hypothetical protein